MIERYGKAAMSFRLWFYLGKVAFPLLFVTMLLAILAGAFWPGSELARTTVRLSVGTLIGLGIIGGLLGVLMVLGSFHFRCPFCGLSCTVGGGPGLQLSCQSCGVVHGSGWLGLRLVREKIEDNDNVQSLPSWARPAGVPVFPDGLRFFRSWKSARWFLLMLVPALASPVAAWVRGRGAGEALIQLSLGITCSVVLFVVLSSGMISSNVGTYYRRTEPFRYWVSVTVIGLAYLGLCLVGYWM